MNNLPKLNMVRRERSMIEGQITLVSSRINKIRSNSNKLRKDVIGIRRQIQIQQAIKRRRQKQQAQKIRRQISSNSQSYDLQEQIRIKRQLSNSSRQSVYQDLFQQNFYNAQKIKRQKTQRHLQIQEQFYEIKQNRKKNAQKIKQQLANIYQGQKKLEQQKRQISINNYRQKCKQQMRKRDDIKIKLKTLQKEEQQQLLKLQDSQRMKYDAIQQFNRTVQFKRRKDLQNRTTLRKFDRFS